MQVGRKDSGTWGLLYWDLINTAMIPVFSDRIERVRAPASLQELGDYLLDMAPRAAAISAITHQMPDRIIEPMNIVSPIVKSVCIMVSFSLEKGRARNVEFPTRHCN
jgi:hypothetical protein